MRKRKKDKTIGNSNLSEFSFDNYQCIDHIICPNCGELHKLHNDSARIGTFVYCNNFSNNEMWYKYPHGRAYIIEFVRVRKKE